MSATFNTPTAAVLLAVELLLFQWKLRSLLDHWIEALLGGDTVGTGSIIAYDLIDRPVVTAYPAESCRTEAERTARAKRETMGC